jgi:hypothetical protein
MSTETYSRSRPSARRLVSGLFAGAWHVEVLVLLAALAIGFGLGLLLGSFLLGFVVVLALAAIVFFVFSQRRPPTSPRSRGDAPGPSAPRAPEAESDRSRVHS